MNTWFYSYTVKNIYLLLVLLSLCGMLAVQVTASHYDWNCMQVHMDGARLTVNGVMCYRGEGVGREYIPWITLQERLQQQQKRLECETAHPTAKYMCDPRYVPPVPPQHFG